MPATAPLLRFDPPEGEVAGALDGPATSVNTAVGLLPGFDRVIVGPACVPVFGMFVSPKLGTP